MSLILALLASAEAASRLLGPFDDSTAVYTRVTNGTLESGTGTDLSSWTEYTAATFGRTTTYRYLGSSGAGINDATWTGSPGKAITQSVAVTASAWYVLSGYVYEPKAGGNVYLDLNDVSYVQKDGGTGDCAAFATVWAEWQFVSCEFQVPTATTTVTVRMVVDGTWAAPGVAGFDEIALTPSASFRSPTSLDVDMDTYTAAEGDCDDAVATTFPGAADAWYDGVDANCAGDDDYDADVDGIPQPTDCDDTSAAIGAASRWYADADDDGFGDLGAPTDACAAPPDAVSSSTDCDDADGDVFPGASEVCDGIDQDCDAEIDEGVKSPWYADTDEDGFGDAAAQTMACSAPPGATDDSSDCDDADGDVFPGATEVCDEVDQDCDAEIDEGLTLPTWYADADGDGFGDVAAPTEACAAPADAVSSSTDCDDADGDVFPGAVEVCDDADQDCDGAADDGVAVSTWYADADEDGFGDDGVTLADCALPEGYVAAGGDCDDDDPSIGLTVSTWYTDADEDGFGDLDAPVDACVAPEGATDDATDCDDADPDVFPEAPERCDGVDQDCDGVADDDVTTSTWYPDADGDGFGQDAGAVEDCAPPDGFAPEGGDCDDDDPEAFPGAAEAPGDGVDQDCDGLDAAPGSSRAWAAEETPPQGPSEGCACASGAPPAGLLPAGLLAALIRRAPGGRRRWWARGRRAGAPSDPTPGTCGRG